MEETVHLQSQHTVYSDPFKPWKDVFDHLVCGVVLIDVSTRKIAYANRVALTMTKWEEEEILGGSCHDFICPAEINHCPLLDHARSIDLDERVILGKDGRPIPILKRVTRIEIEGRPYVLESFTDIHAQKERESELETLYGTDTLTGLPNRASLEKIIEDMKMGDPMHPQVHSLIMADLDLFKNINDRFGHQAGDEVLREFGFVLKESMRKIDVVFRWGG
ncbi:MAG: diguanylate cyclase, partial [Erysipelotrichaceae bacterium]|nr:diguanylate cyclase [Erysipelotrichaceae bacterium]